MEMIIGFAAGYLVGAQEGRDGLERLRSSLRAIANSPATRRLALDAVTAASSVLRGGQMRGGQMRGGEAGSRAGGLAELAFRKVGEAVAARRS